MDLRQTAKKHALKNALDYGKAEIKSVAGRVIAEAPEAKKDMKETMRLITEVIAEVNVLPRDELEKQASGFVYAEKKVEERKLTLPGTEQGKVVTRFLPEPNGPAHIGHAKAAWLGRELASEHDGKCLLRWDDTNPEKEKQEYEDNLRESMNWLGLKFDGKETRSSDYLDVYYEKAARLIEQDAAFVCKCPQGAISANRKNKKECVCRLNDAKKNAEEWVSMLGGVTPEGKAVLRLKGDMASDNTTMRDPVIFRIIEAEHYRVKGKRVWPNYDFAVSVADSLEGVTHALRSKEYELRDELYGFILDKLKMRKPFVYDFSRLNIKGTLLSKRLLVPLIESKKVSGWDDPRLPTVSGLKRRGILPEAIKKFVLSQGLGKQESEPDWSALLNENKRLLEPKAPHYFFVSKPVKLLVKNSRPQSFKVPKHPAQELGHRFFETDKYFFISKDDFTALKQGETFRLKDLYNVKVLEKKTSELVGEFAGKDLREGRKLQWVPEKEFVEAEIWLVGDLVDSSGEFKQNSLVKEKGYAELAVKDVKKGAVAQFERLGFFICDDPVNKIFIACC
ncbi:MAG: glutamate--tRNA ligase [Candidatus Micrarchaeota archaeon]